MPMPGRLVLNRALLAMMEPQHARTYAQVVTPEQVYRSIALPDETTDSVRVESRENGWAVICRPFSHR